MLQNNTLHSKLKKAIDDELINVDRSPVLLYKCLFDRCSLIDGLLNERFKPFVGVWLNLIDFNCS
jgi:hypothetical protein